jgi:hypothetical protein
LWSIFPIFFPTPSHLNAFRVIGMCRPLTDEGWGRMAFDYFKIVISNKVLGNKENAGCHQYLNFITIPFVAIMN